MKTAALKDVKAKLSEYCERAQTERVLITRHGKPLAIIIGVEGQDLEEVLTVSNPDFWRMVEERRAEPTLSEAELRRRLERGRTRPARRAAPTAKAAKVGKTAKRKKR